MHLPKNHAILYNKGVQILNNWLIAGNYFVIIESVVNILLLSKILPLKTMLKPKRGWIALAIYVFSNLNEYCYILYIANNVYF